MDALIGSITGALNAAGGGVAVAFIILLAAGILAMTLVYLGSALLVLDRFARVATGWLRRRCWRAFASCSSLRCSRRVGSIPSDSPSTAGPNGERSSRIISATGLSCLLFVALIARALLRFLSQSAHGVSRDRDRGARTRTRARYGW